VVAKDAAITDMLLAAGADPNVRDKYGRTAVRVCAWAGTTDILRQLLAHGGDVNTADSGGLTPLMAATYWCIGDVAARVDVLLGHVDTDLTAQLNGQTAAQLAGGGQSRARATYQEDCLLAETLSKRITAAVC
jgi:hypothetical protein